MTKREFRAQWSKRANKEGRIEVKSHRGTIELIKPDSNDFVRVVLEPFRSESNRVYRSSSLIVRVNYDDQFFRTMIEIQRTVRQLNKEYFAANTDQWAKELTIDKVEYLWNWMRENVEDMRKAPEFKSLDRDFLSTFDYAIFLDQISHPRIYTKLIELQDSGYELNLIDETK